MKSHRLSCIVLSVILVGLLVAMPAEAQQRVNPNTVPTYFTWPIRTADAYANSQVDTSGAFALGATNKLSILITTTDSVTMDLYIDYRLIGSPTWTQIVADSMKLYVDTLNVKEFVLRDNDSDALDQVGCEIRIRESHRATLNGTTTAYKDVAIIWKP